jgi:hypothetical protein
MKTEQIEFATRLRQALQQAGHKESPTKLSRAFNSVTRGNPVTVHAVRKWLVGESMPTQGRMIELASILGVEVTWLRFGGHLSAPTTEPMTLTQIMLTKRLAKLTEDQCAAVAGLLDAFTEQPAAQVSK